MLLSRPFDEQGKSVRGYRKKMHNICNIWKERRGLKVTEQRVCYEARVNEWVANGTRDECNQKKRSE